MAIHTMCSPDTPGAVRDDYWSKQSGHEIWMETTHVGLVVGEREMNGYDDSDFYAVVWNDAKGEPEEIMFASTRGWTYPNGCQVDATDEVRAKYQAYLDARDRAARKLAAEREAATPRVGRRAVTRRSVRGKQAIEAGVTGRIFWVGIDRFSRSYYGAPPKIRVGFETDDGRKVFIAADALTVTGGEA